MIKSRDKIKSFKLFFGGKKKLKKRVKGIVLFFAVLLLVIDMAKFKFIHSKFHDLSSVTYSAISYPLFLVQNSYSEIKNYILLISTNKTVYLENQKLKEQIQGLELIKAENNDLRRLVNFQDNLQFSKVTGRAVIESYEGFEKQYLLNIGSRNGVGKGNAIVNRNRLVGRIIDVSQKSSKMQLITNKNSKIPISILGTEYNGIAGGINKEKYLKVFYLPQDINIDDGKIVVTSGEGGYMPYGVYVGKTKKIDGEIFVETCLNCNNVIRLVSILKLEENFASAKKK